MSKAVIRELKEPSSTLSLYARALTRTGGGTHLPDITVRLRDVMVDSKHLRNYCKVCGFSESDTLPVTFPHILAFPLHMEIMVSKGFPFKLLGLVHISNTITQYRAIGKKEQLDIEVSFGSLEPHDKGQQFSVLTSVTTGGELVWESQSTMLSRGAGSGNRDKKKPADKPEPATATLDWKVPASMGRSYAAVSGDRNPIHLYPLTAKLFGFPRHIVHGMWSKARILAELEHDYPQGPFTVHVDFKLPILLPATVKFEKQAREHGIDFRLLGQDGIKPHLSGWLAAVSDDNKNT